MKYYKMFYPVFSFILALGVAFSSCQKNDDLATKNAKTGGLVVPSEPIPYKLGMTPSLDIEVNVPKGPGVKTVHVDYYYANDSVKSNVQSFDIPVNGENRTLDVVKKIPYTWDKLIAGVVMPKGPQLPASEQDPDIAKYIGNYWNFSYTSTMEDGRKLINNNTTKIAIANFFAGAYDVETSYFHPTAGGAYPVEPYGGVRKSTKNLIPLSPYKCKVFFGVWEDNFTMINIDKDNNVEITFDRPAFSGDPKDATKKNTYDTKTGVIQIYYYYPGAGGDRIFWEKFTPKKQ